MALPVEATEKDTIAAICTGMTESGIGIIRISGPEAFAVGDRLYRNRHGEQTLLRFQPGTIHFGLIVDPETGEQIDEAMVSVMRHPHSYTTEDTVEINCHGGVYLMNRILALVLRNGARLAEPGEFTKRAFEGGRIDLAKAEAVMDLIASQNEFARKTAIGQLEGSISEKVATLRSAILYELAFIESALDDPENYSTEGYPEKLHEKLDSLITEMDRMLANAENGRILKEGIRTVIIGRPNAGKSSLLNMLSRSDRAIVTDVAGTTRDTLEENVRIGSLTLHLVDTAGIRETGDTVERIGVDRARRAAQNADLLLFILDSASPLTKEDKDAAELFRSLVYPEVQGPFRERNIKIDEAEAEGSFDGKTGRHFGKSTDTFSKPVRGIVLLNKSDLQAVVTEADARKLIGIDNGSDENIPILSVSMKTGDGVDLLEQEISREFHEGELLSSNEVVLTNVRHRIEIEKARDSLLLVEKSIESGMSEDFYSIDLMNAYAALGRILGLEVDDDLVEEIFSKFCLGK